MRPITASDLMNPEVLTVREDMSVADLAAFLLDNEITGAPVADGDGALVGVVSVVDIAAVASEGAAEAPGLAYYDQGWDDELPEEAIEELQEELEEGEELTVADIMTPEIYSVSEDATVSEIASLMLAEHLHRLLVSRDGKAVGIISTSDLLGLLVDEN